MPRPAGRVFVSEPLPSCGVRRRGCGHDRALSPARKAGGCWATSSSFRHSWRDDHPKLGQQVPEVRAQGKDQPDGLGEPWMLRGACSSPSFPLLLVLPISVPTLTPAPRSPGVPRPFTSWVVSSEPTVASWSPQDAGFSDLQALLLPFPGRDGGVSPRGPSKPSHHFASCLLALPVWGSPANRKFFLCSV